MLELRRNIFHLLFGCFIAVLVKLLSFIDAAALLSAALGAGFIFSESIRRGVHFPVLNWFLERLERDGKRPGKGVLTFVLGSLITLLFFGKEIAFAAILILSFEDSFSTVFGKLYGKTKLRMNKTLEGATAGFVACFAVSVFILPFSVAFVACVLATITEFFAFVDDNILIPVVTGGLIYMLL